jgi:quinohemoprotein ethanol dehydrogenase
VEELMDAIARRAGFLGRAVLIVPIFLALVSCGDRSGEESAPEEAVVARAPAAEPAAAAPARFNIDGRRIEQADSEPGNWLAHGRTYSEQRYSPLDQINQYNVSDLGLGWAYATGAGRGHEATPIVVDGTMFLTLPWSKVVALNAATGEHLWDYDPEVPPEWGRNACCDVVNRGVAVWKGNVYVGALDGRLIALDGATGARVWEVQTTDRELPYTITGAPRVVNDKVIIGNGGAEFGVRGYITAYDAETGEQAWRFYTVPGNPEMPFEHSELEEAAQTWTGEWWKLGGGGTAWDSMAYDPDLNLLYVGTGNGSPWNRRLRSPGGGDNLYLSSILAIDPDTGRLAWHYQTTPADTWDYTATQHMVLAELEIDGRERKVLMQAPKNGFFYVLDRETGELLSAKNYVTVTWASHVDAESGRPVETGGDYKDSPKLVFPSPVGGHNWHPMAYNPQTKLVYIPAIESPWLYVDQKDFEPLKNWWNTGTDTAQMIQIAKLGPAPEVNGFLKAWDPVRQQEMWRVQLPGAGNGGVLTTAGNLVFQGTSDGRLSAYQADTGEKLWDIGLNVGIVAPPISYRIEDEQYVAVVAGWGGVPPILGADPAVAAATTHVNAGHVFAFKLGGTSRLPEIEVKRFTTVPPPPEDDATPQTIARGEALYHVHCATCHGMNANSTGVLADLRFSSRAVHDSFDKIVLEGVLSNVGMASFADLLNEEDVAATHSYIISRAREDREAQLKAAQ